MNTQRTSSSILVYIGRLKVAEVCWDNSVTEWRYSLRILDDPAPPRAYQTMGAVFTELHRMLNNP